jgi:ribose/xylose/arabinose/galactoside ABC-type transport system permease subunit
MLFSLRRRFPWHRWGSWIFLLFLILAFSPGYGFFTFTNLQNVVTDSSFMLLLAVAQTSVIILGGLDLSTGFVMGLSSVISALCMISLSRIFPLPAVLTVAVLSGLLAGMCIGWLNGIVIARLRVSPFVVTLGMMGTTQGVGYLLANGNPLSVPGVTGLGSANILYILPNRQLSWWHVPAGLSVRELREVIGVLPLQLIVTIIVVAVCTWIMARSRFGLHTYAIGGNYEAARRSGIAVQRHTIIIYIISSFLAALAGILYMVRNSTGSTDAGGSLLLGSVAAVILGGTSLAGGSGSILGTITGTLIIAVIENGLIIIGVDPFWQYVITGIIIVIAVVIYRNRYKHEHEK